MLIEATDAWVLHIERTRESSAYVTFLTRNHGLIKCTYRGVRTKGLAALQVFTPLWLSAQLSHRGGFVRNIEIKSPLLTFRNQHVLAAFYVNELLYHALKPNDVVDHLFEHYEATLYALSSAEHTMVMEILLRRFEWILIQSCGYGISLDRDITGALIMPDALYQLMVNEGFKKAHEGMPGHHILAIYEGCLDNQEVLKAAKQIMRHMIHHMLGGKPIRSRQLYQEAMKRANGHLN